MTYKLKLTEDECRNLHGLQSALSALHAGRQKAPSATACEPFGLFAMLQGGWNEAAAESRQRLGAALASTGTSPTVLLGALQEFLSNSSAVLQAEAPLALLVRAALVDLQEVMNGYADASKAHLQQALEMALETKLELQEFAKVASHDLKTPLGTVANLCDEALDEFGECLPADGRKLIGAARNQAFELSRTIDRLLEATAQHHIAAGDGVASLGGVLANATSRVRSRFPMRPVEVHLLGALPEVCANSLRLCEAFYQILSSCVDASEGPAAEITVDVVAVSNECIVRVSHKGLPRNNDNLDHLFRPFFRSELSRANTQSGLRLYFAKRLIEQHGGRIWAEASPEPSGAIVAALRLRDGANRLAR